MIDVCDHFRLNPNPKITSGIRSIAFLGDLVLDGRAVDLVEGDEEIGTALDVADHLPPIPQRETFIANEIGHIVLPRADGRSAFKFEIKIGEVYHLDHTLGKRFLMRLRKA